MGGPRAARGGVNHRSDEPIADVSLSSAAMMRVSAALLLSITGVSAFGSWGTTPPAPTCSNGVGDDPTFEDYPFQYTCADWAEDYNFDGNADCAVADAITDPAMCLAADGSTLMDADGYPCEVRPPSPRPPLTIPGHHARVRGMDPRTSLSPLIMSRNTGWRPRGQLWLLLHRKPHGRGPPQLPRHLLVRLRVSAIAQARSSDLDISVSVLATLRAPYEPNAERSFTQGPCGVLAL